MRLVTFGLAKSGEVIVLVLMGGDVTGAGGSRGHGVLQEGGLLLVH
jgi:hypothetical protein